MSRRIVFRYCQARDLHEFVPAMGWCASLRLWPPRLSPSIFLLLAALLLPQANIRAQDTFETGLAAIQRGDYAEAYCLWKPLAEKGDPKAQFNLAWMYANGDGLNIDMEKAVSWWRRSAKQGFADSQFTLGLGYMTGEGLPKDPVKAVQWFLKAAHQGHEDAQHILRDLAGKQRPKLRETFAQILKTDWKALGNQRAITADFANLRSGPGLRFKVTTQMKLDQLVIFLRRKGRWVLAGIPVKGQLAWVHQSLLRKL